jgi:hypothetical protein
MIRLVILCTLLGLCCARSAKSASVQTSSNTPLDTPIETGVENSREIRFEPFDSLSTTADSHGRHLDASVRFYFQGEDHPKSSDDELSARGSALIAWPEPTQGKFFTIEMRNKLNSDAVDDACRKALLEAFISFQKRAKRENAKAVTDIRSYADSDDYSIVREKCLCRIGNRAYTTLRGKLVLRDDTGSEVMDSPGLREEDQNDASGNSVEPSSELSSNGDDNGGVHVNRHKAVAGPNFMDKDWYIYNGVGVSFLSYPSTFHDVANVTEGTTGNNSGNVGISLDLLEVYYSFKRQDLLLGAALFNGSGTTYETVNGRVYQVNEYIYGISGMYFMGAGVGQGPFLRADFGYGKLADGYQMSNQSNSAYGFGALAGGGWAFCVARKLSVLANLDYSCLELQNEYYGGLRLSAGVLF